MTSAQGPISRTLQRLRPRLFYGWYVAWATVLVRTAATGSGMWSFTVFIAPLEEAFGWSRAQVSLAMSITFLVQGIMGPLVGRWIDRHGVRVIVVVGAGLVALAMVVLSQIQALWQLYLGYLIMAVGRSCFSYIPLNTLMASWFIRKRGTAIGIGNAGMGLGGLVFVPLTQFLVSTLGWRQSYQLLGLITFLAVVPVTLLIIRRRPEDLGLLPDGDSPRQYERPKQSEELSPRSRGEQDGLGLKEALASRAFWLMSIAFLLIFTSQMSLNTHAVPFLVSLGQPQTEAAMLVGYAAALSILGRFTSGYVADRLGATKVALLLFQGIAAVSVALVMLAPGPVSVWFFVVLFGFSMGAAPTLEPLLLGECFGLRHYGTLLGLVGVVETVGIISGPVFAGYIYDVSGSYAPALAVFVGALLLALLALWALPLPRHRPQVSPAIV